jgi:hypothetical protein
MITGGLALDYISDINASFDQKEREELVVYVNEALQLAKEISDRFMKPEEGIHGLY